MSFGRGEDNYLFGTEANLEEHEKMCLKQIFLTIIFLIPILEASHLISTKLTLQGRCLLTAFGFVHVPRPYLIGAELRTGGGLCMLLGCDRSIVLISHLGKILT